ncbi:glyoxalase-like domain protein [Geobacillus kaustophilus]|uniref:Glyoxalase-like domain protein n=1 Tax=Geobacillus kaustophilus TaxID=1462 RepID=A0A0D8BPC3_GEOKU|nr:VOC family protein [Geobacillus kaustophilus]KJE26063.1 glyoxalase-like domain protein [Geobacillus kaustophilus]
MNVAFDHLVHLTERPEQAKAAFEQLGFTSIHGGRHPSWGTYNALCYFDHLRYIEWIGIADEQTAKTCGNPLIAQLVADREDGNGFSQFAFRTNDIETLAAQLKNKGFTPIGPLPGSRQRYDGKRLTWTMLFIEDDIDGAFRYPFFIQWGDDDDVRMNELAPLIRHPVGSLFLSSISVYTLDLRRTIDVYRRLFGLPAPRFGRDEAGAYAELAVGGITLHFYEAHRQPSTRPFLCRLVGIQEQHRIEIDGGTYIVSRS